MSDAKHTPGPFVIEAAQNKHDRPIFFYIVAGDRIIASTWSPNSIEQQAADARLFVAAPELLEAAQMLEAAEKANVNCEDCEGEGVPELCGTCFPLFDDARIKRRAAIAKATGGAS